MYYVSEQSVQRVVTQADVTQAVEAVYAAMARGEARNFPVVREGLNYADAIFGFKSGFDRAAPALGVKAGGLWPGNMAKGLANHQSTVLLFDPETGAPQAIVCAAQLTALRTAAASALSIRWLARPDANQLGVLGAGGQCESQIRAALVERRFEVVRVADKDFTRAEALAEVFRREGLHALACGAEEMARASDVIITVTPAFEPVIRSAWIAPGSHLACMGADTRGKQEVEASLVARARLFGDELSQVLTIGECQHAYGQGMIAESDITPLSSVICGLARARTDALEVTLFDSTGVGLQDVAAGAVALRKALEAGEASLLP